MSGESEVTTIPKIRRIFRMTKANLDILVGLRDGALAYATDEAILYRQNGDGAANWEAITTLGSLLTVAETEVFNGNSPNNVWTDLDLSGVIGTNTALVLLKVNSASDGFTLAMRKNGDADLFQHADIDTRGCANISFDATHNPFVLLVATDINGVIEWILSGARLVVIDIIAYIV